MADVDGPLQSGKRAALILDIITTPQPVLRAAEVLKQRGCRAVALVGLLNLLTEKERKKLHERGLVVHAIYNNEDELLSAGLNEF